MFGDGIFTQEGAAWKHSRELLRPEFVHKQYENLDVFRDAVDDLINALPSNGGIVDLQPLFFRLTLDTTTAFLFGESVRSLRAPDSAGEQTFADAFNIAQEYVAKRFRLLDLYWLIGGKKFNEACSNVHKFADAIIQRNLSAKAAKSEKNDTPTFLDTVAQSISDRSALRSQIINVLVAGRDTTACLLAWTLYGLPILFFPPVLIMLCSFTLVRHPEALTKLRIEIDQACNNKLELNRNDLRGMTYLQNVMKEGAWYCSLSHCFLLILAQYYAFILLCLSILEQLSRRLFYQREVVLTGNPLS